MNVPPTRHSLFPSSLHAGGRILGHTVMMIVGVLLMFLGMALGVTMVALPLGLPLGLVGLLLFVAGMSAADRYEQG